MKKFFALIFVLLCSTGLWAQDFGVQPNKPDSVFVVLSDVSSAFVKCFTNVDKNKDGMVSYREAAAADSLYLGYGGRKNIINNLDFLKHFPNLKYLVLGNYTGEEADLSYMKKLEMLDLTLAIFLKKITISAVCAPKLYFPHGQEEFVIKRVSDPNDSSTWWN